MALNRETSGGRWRIRPDGPGKVTGSLAYLTDMTAPNMLHGLVLRSPHAHARILGIRTEEALALPGVHAVLTHADVPGLNRFGIAHPDHPVFCEDRARFVGDAIAAVAADSAELALEALALIEVDYEYLPVVSDPEQAMREEAPRLHEQGNIQHRNDYVSGDAEAAFAACAHIVEETYETPRQMHTYMETEGGLFVPEADGRLTVYSPTQHGLMDRMQLARILDRPEESIRIVSSPIGGSFGGKDELNVQPYGALLALACGHPVKLHNSRFDSVRAGLKRHPMRITMKTGVDAGGKLLAHRVRIVSDAGPYSSLSAEVLNFAVEHALGPYRYGAAEVRSFCMFTNNGMSGEFRGFGGNQAIFALEGQMDRLAEKLGIDPWELRRRNLRQPDDPGPFGQPIAPTDGARQVWDALPASRLWRERTAAEGAGHGSSSGGGSGTARPPWLKTGYGAAFVMHGAGLGVGIPDPAGGRLTLAPDGKIEAAFGYEEFGQGLIASLEQMLIEKFGFGAGDLRIVIGDTDAVPDSGSSTASRATSMMWQALERMRAPFSERLLEEASRVLAVPKERLRAGEGGVRDAASGRLLLAYGELAQAATEPIACEMSFRYPASPVDRVGAHYLYSYSSVGVKVEVNTLTGRVKVLEQFHAVAAGPVVNPQGFLGQIEGGSSMALGFTLTENAAMNEGMYLTRNLDSYLIPTIAEQRGRVEVLPIEELPEGDTHGPRGIGEIGSVGLAPAIAQAIYDAVGKRVKKLPVDPAELQEVPDFAKEGSGSA